MEITTGLQTLLSKNGGAILDNISDNQLEEDTYIREQLHKVDVSEDEDFQERYKKLHDFRRNRVKLIVQKRFFEVLEIQKEKEEQDPREISHLMFGTRLKGKYKAKHFSLVSRMMNTIDDSYPIYDRGVGEVFGFKAPQSRTTPTYKKLNAYIAFYEEMNQVYEELLEEKKPYNLLKVLEIKYKEHKEHLSFHKRLDLLIRSAGELKRKGKLLHERQLSLTV